MQEKRQKKKKRQGGQGGGSFSHKCGSGAAILVSRLHASCDSQEGSGRHPHVATREAANKRLFAAAAAANLRCTGCAGVRESSTGRKGCPGRRSETAPGMSVALILPSPECRRQEWARSHRSRRWPSTEAPVGYSRGRIQARKRKARRGKREEFKQRRLSTPGLTWRQSKATTNVRAYWTYGGGGGAVCVPPFFFL